MRKNQFVFGLFICVAVRCNPKPTASVKTAAEKYDRAIDALAVRTPASETEHAIALIESAGLDAFSALMARLDDKSDACDLFRNSVGYFGGGPYEPYHPSIGDACFDLLREQIEGFWPKGFREFHVLSKANVRDWLNARSNRTLNELRVECAEQTLASVKRKHDQNPTAWTDTCVKFFIENLAKAQNRTVN